MVGRKLLPRLPLLWVKLKHQGGKACQEKGTRGRHHLSENSPEPTVRVEMEIRCRKIVVSLNFELVALRHPITWNWFGLTRVTQISCMWSSCGSFPSMQFHLAYMIKFIYDFDFYTSNQEGIQGIQDLQLNPIFVRFLFQLKASFLLIRHHFLLQCLTKIVFVIWPQLHFDGNMCGVDNIDPSLFTNIIRE